MRPFPRPVWLTLLLTAAATAQPQFRGLDRVVVNDGSNRALYRVSAANGIQQIPLPFQPAGLAGLCGTRQGELVLADYRTGDIHLLDPSGSSRVLAQVPGALRVAEDLDGSFLVTSFQSRSIERVTRSGQVTNIVTLPSPTRPFDVVVDGDGNYIYCNDRSGPKGVFKVDRATSVITPIYTGFQLPLPHGLAFFPNGDLAVMDGINDAIYRLEISTGRLTTFVSNQSLGNNPESIVETEDGGFLLALESVNLGYSMIEVDRNGVITTIGTNGPFTNMEQVAVVPAVTGPASVTTGGGAPFRFDLDVPSQPNRPYFLGLSGGLYPGFGPPNDVRQLSVRGDSLFLGTLTGGSAGIFMNWNGRLDANGRATPTLDLRTLPPGIFAGFQGYIQGFTTDPSAPNNVGRFTTVLPLAFR